MRERRVLTTKCVAQAWEDLCLNKSQLIIESFRNLRLSLPIDGSGDELNIKGFEAESLVIGDWSTNGYATGDEELSLRDTKAENTGIDAQSDDSQVVKYIDGGAMITWSVSVI